MADRHFMNKQHERHMSGGDSHEEHGGSGKHPSIHVHSHAKGHTVHVMHHDGRHEKHEHEHGDAEGIAAHIHEHIGGEQGQDHGFSSGSDMEDEFGAGPGV
jgi:hypothetical protein